MRLELLAIFTFAIVSSQALPGTVPSSVINWWNGLPDADRTRLVRPFDDAWFANLETSSKAAYAKVVLDLHEFMDTGADSHPSDSYEGFEPLLLRTSFHSSGTFHKKSGTGGSNGGTIFEGGELQDPQNGCIAIATDMLQDLLGSQYVPMADCVVIGGIVALDRMEFPRMDLIKMTGGRKDSHGVAHRDRLPSADDDPLARFTEQMGFSMSELVALIGGSHNFGSAHGKCSGYEGQWTSNPLSWGGANGDAPQFFVDLMRTDWKWYEVCTFHDGSVNYKSIADPFAGDMEEEEEEGGDGSLEEACDQAGSKTPVICEEQAMRGCEFQDGVFEVGTLPCETAILRLKSDFWLKMNPALAPHAQQYADDAALFAQDFGNAYHKLTHNGLARCGQSGHGCADGTQCEATRDDDGAVLYEQCVKVAEDEDGLGKGGWVGIGIAISTGVFIILGLFYLLMKLNRPAAAVKEAPSPPPEPASVRGVVDIPKSEASPVQVPLPAPGPVTAHSLGHPNLVHAQTYGYPGMMVQHA